MSNQVDNVSIDLRNLDRINLLGEFDKENGGQRSTSAKPVKEIIKAPANGMHKWNTFFIIVCSFAVFIDPLFCYINVIVEDHMCFIYDMKLLWTYIGLRMVVDVFYAVDIIIYFCGIFKRRKGKKLWACWKSRNNQKNEVPWKQVIKRWYSMLLPILPGILVALPIPELFGALWYRLAVQRQIDCWKPYCKTVPGNRCKKTGNFQCGYNYPLVNITLLQELCPTKDENSKVFDLGIYSYALHSNVTNSLNLPRRMSQSFWWALRNLSSFGSNLITSTQLLEIIFSVAISISGMALFLVYLNARVQESLERSSQLKLKEKHLTKPDIDLWLSKNGLSNLKTMTKSSMDLKTTNKTKKALRTVIIENVHKIEENKDIDMQNIISILPIKYKKSIMRLLCLASLKKVPMLENLNEKMLNVICEHLKPVIYIEDNYIIQEGKPLGMTLFITQGIAWSYTVSNNIGAETSCGSSSNKWLKRGDYYGEELLKWAFKCTSYSDLPISTRTVMSQEKVEAFALRASDLKSIVSKYWWHFTREVPQVDLDQWENSAASSIQAAWCSRRLARARHSNGWDIFTVEN
ncbi:putative cyclic nucleotide-gated ion channel 13 isoform X2 [Rosa chinensis]|uniref:putative cyclic nucleotide-gated ion channel 13 isoform X2 n=1 Tax=Rosa chinensis TaxID=74649 RepID=UPI001AD8A39B|nr:putative cyclic nucleotide-gated ion channel 13 isoform X2 [Rosa chinensis]